MSGVDEARERRMRAQLETIEVRLAAHPQVAAAAAMVRGERLVAYVAAKAGGGAPDVEALRRHACAALPSYMVPSQFVMLDALPMAAQGGIDRAALPEPAATAAPGDGAAAEAAGGRDARIDYLVSLWSQLLGRPAGVDDNFFDIGGHSMLAVQMANRVRQDTGVRIQLMTLASLNLGQIAAELPRDMKPATGLGARLVGNLRGLLWGARAAG